MFNAYPILVVAALCMACLPSALAGDDCGSACNLLEATDPGNGCRPACLSDDTTQLLRQSTDPGNGCRPGCL